MLKRELRGSLYNNNIIWDHLSRICTWHWNPTFDLVPVHTVSLLEVTSEVQVGKVRDGSLRREQMKFDSARSIWLIKLERVEERKGLSIRTWSSQRSTLPLDSSSSVNHRIIARRSNYPRPIFRKLGGGGGGGGAGKFLLARVIVHLDLSDYFEIILAGSVAPEARQLETNIQGIRREM